jgi:hypothetical protein
MHISTIFKAENAKQKMWSTLEALFLLSLCPSYRRFLQRTLIIHRIFEVNNDLFDQAGAKKFDPVCGLKSSALFSTFPVILASW